MTKTQLKTSAFFCLKGKINFQVGEKIRKGKGEKKEKKRIRLNKQLSKIN